MAPEDGAHTRLSRWLASGRSLQHQRSTPTPLTLFAERIPTLAVEDRAVRKVLAILVRTEGSDFADLWALSVRTGRHQSLAWSQQLGSCATAGDVASALESRTVPGDRGAVPTSFEEWVAELRAGRD